MIYSLICWFSQGEKGVRRVGAKRILYQFDQLEQIPILERPKFTFAHILLTHPPYHFDKSGEIIRPKIAKQKEEKTLYLDSIAFANKKILDLVDKIIEKSERPPVIILQADEGPYSGMIKNVKRGKGDKRRLRSGILNAIYFPDKGQELLYETISPVNTFRLIFNIYFGANLELLDDRTFVFKSRKNLYQFTDITLQLDFGALLVRSKPRRAKIFLNGKFTGFHTNRSLSEIEPGTYTLKLVKPKYKEFTKTIKIEAGDKKTIRAVLTRE